VGAVNNGHHHHPPSFFLLLDDRVTAAITTPFPHFFPTALIETHYI
jgi:hypothetical protein